MTDEILPEQLIEKKKKLKNIFRIIYLILFILTAISSVVMAYFAIAFGADAPNTDPSRVIFTALEILIIPPGILFILKKFGDFCIDKIGTKMFPTTGYMFSRVFIGCLVLLVIFWLYLVYSPH